MSARRGDPALGREAVTVGHAAVAALALCACHNLSSFSTASGGYYEGAIVGSSFVRSGLGDAVRMCLLIDTDHLQDAPGTISTDDGRFEKTALRPIPQFFQDPLSSFNFGEGRIQNVLYVAGAAATEGGLEGGAPAEPSGDVFVVISFMSSGDIEVRLLRGAPPVPGNAKSAGPPNLFGVFNLSRGAGSCPF